MNSREMFSFSYSNTKSIALVKLSTEALQCIEEYARIGASAGFKPTIQVKDGQGVLSIPGMNSVESFSFSLSDVDENGSQGSLQCVEKSQNGEMTSLGNVETKMQIHAKTASITHTKSKIEADDEKQKKFGAKVIRSSSSSQATSSQAIEQTSQAESSTPRERKKAVPLLKKLLSRNFLKGLRSGNAAVSRTVSNSAPPRAAVLLTEPPPIINSKEQKIMEMKKKRMLEDSAGEAYSDPRRKKQRISHCSQSEPSPANKVNPIVGTIKSETVTSAHANKAQSQETKKRKRISQDIKKDPTPINKVNESQTPIANALNIVKSEKVVSVHANNTQCRETKRGISLNNQIKSEPGIKNEYNKAQTPSISKSKVPVVKPDNKTSFLEAKDLRRTLKNRRRRRRQKQKKRAQKRAALMESSVSRIPPVRESQSHKNTLTETSAVVVKTEEPTNNMNLISPKNTFSEIPAAVAKIQEPKHNLYLISPKTTLSETPAAVAKTQSETPVALVEPQESKSNLNPVLPKNTLSETSAAVAKIQKPKNTLIEPPSAVAKTEKTKVTSFRESSVAVVKTQELKELCKRIEQPLAKTEKRNLFELKKQHTFSLDTTEPSKKKLKMAQDNQNDIPFVNTVKEVFSIGNLDSTSTKSNGSNFQDPNFTQKDTKSERVEEGGKLSKASTKSLDCLEPSVLDILPAKSTKSEVQLPDLVQHCERVVIKDPSDNEDSIIPSLTNEQMEMHTEDSEIGTDPPLGPTRIPGTSPSSSKDSVLCSNKCKSRNPPIKQPCCNYGCEVTSTTKRMQTPCTQEMPMATTSSDGKSAAIVTLFPTETAISGGLAEFEEITTLEQRSLYKTIFAEKFEEYENLQEDLSIYDKYLQSLAHTRKAYSKGSDDYNKVKAKFHKSFNYHKRRTAEYAALHTRLEKIKGLVMRFDSKF